MTRLHNEFDLCDLTLSLSLSAISLIGCEIIVFNAINGLKGLWFYIDYNFVINYDSKWPRNFCYLLLTTRTKEKRYDKEKEWCNTLKYSNERIFMWNQIFKNFIDSFITKRRNWQNWNQLLSMCLRILFYF